MPTEDALVLGQGKRVALAVLFLDISGWSSRPSYTLQEQSTNLQVLNLFFTEVVRIAEDYGGEVEKNTGDGLLAYFPHGTSDEGVSAVQRATAATLTMFAATEYLINPILRNSNVPPLTFRASLDYGPVTIAKIGAGRGFNSAVAIGTTANFACKMLQHASPGDLVLGAGANAELPSAWRSAFSTLVVYQTGWTYNLTGLPYPLYKYSGRWARVL